MNMPMPPVDGIFQVGRSRAKAFCDHNGRKDVKMSTAVEACFFNCDVNDDQMKMTTMTMMMPMMKTCNDDVCLSWDAAFSRA